MASNPVSYTSLFDGKQSHYDRHSRVFRGEEARSEGRKFASSTTDRASREDGPVADIAALTLEASLQKKGTVIGLETLLSGSSQDITYSSATRITASPVHIALSPAPAA